MNDVDDQTAALLEAFRDYKERVQLARDVDTVICKLHTMSHDEVIRLYNAVVARLVGS